MLILYSCTDRGCAVCCSVPVSFIFFRDTEGIKFSWEDLEENHGMYANMCGTVVLLGLRLFTVFMLSCC